MPNIAIDIFNHFFGMTTTTNIHMLATRPSRVNIANQDRQGEFAGTKVHLVNNSVLLEDIQEEISFAHSEKREEENSKDELILEDYEKHKQYEIYNKIIETYKSHPEHQAKEKHLLNALKERQPRNQQELIAQIEEETQDKAEAFALMQTLSKEETLPQSTRTLIKEAIPQYQKEYSSDIQAGITTYPLSEKHAPKMKRSIAELQGLYQKNIVHYSSILTTLASIAQTLGVEKIEAGASFLSRAIAKDMDSIFASRQPVFLEKILASLRGLNFFHSIDHHITKTLQRLSKHYEAVKSIAKNDLLKRFISFLPKPGHSKLLTDITKPLGEEAEVLLLQELRFGVKSLPDYLFETKQEKQRIIHPIDERIGTLIIEGA